MSPRKLSDSDRQEILELYRQTEETTSSLANRFGVSSSTISRFLKSSLSQSEYEDLIQAKRLSRTSRTQEQKPEKTKTKKSATKSKSKKKSAKQVKAEPSKLSEQLKLNIEEEKKDLNVTFDQQVDEDSLLEEEIIEDDDNQTFEQVEKTTKNTKTEIVVAEGSVPELEEEDEEEEESDQDSLESVQEVAAMFGEDLDEEDDDDDEEDDDDDEEDDDELIEEALSLEQQLEVLSLNEATFPAVCYLVIDRHAELVTKPMKDFAHLGNIPNNESSQKTLPIFDNHKVAKRFCVRKGKVIKVPDGRVLQKTSNYLQAKGISRILMDGKVYSIVD